MYDALARTIAIDSFKSSHRRADVTFLGVLNPQISALGGHCETGDVARRWQVPNRSTTYIASMAIPNENSIVLVFGILSFPTLRSVSVEIFPQFTSGLITILSLY